MVAGHLQEKRGYFYIVLNYKDSNGKRKSKWIATSLPVKGNKRKADELLQQARIEFRPEAEEPKPTAPAVAVPHVADWQRAVCGLYAELAGRHQTLRFAGDLLVVLGNGQGYYRALFQENRNKALSPEAARYTGVL